MWGCKMGKIMEQMNFNYYNRGDSDLAKILLGIEKVSLSNGSYSQMQGLFAREILSSKCFSDEKHQDMDNLINFNANLKNAMYMQQDEYSREDEHSRTR